VNEGYGSVTVSQLFYVSDLGQEFQVISTRYGNEEYGGPRVRYTVGAANGPEVVFVPSTGCEGNYANCGVPVPVISSRR
jgi:hypothetical protein